MSSYAINDMVRITFEWMRGSSADVYKNIVNFRGYTGEIPFTSSQLIFDYLTTTWLDRILGALDEQTYLRKIRIQNMLKDSCPDDERLYDNGEYIGALTTDGGMHPQMSVCFTKRSFQKGRKGIGHFYLGPIAPRFVSEGMTVVDPFGVGDLNDVADALGDPIVVTGLTLRPIVYGPVDQPPAAFQDIRTVSIAPLAVMLKSRRPGVGE